MKHGGVRGSIKVSRDIFEQNFTSKSLEKNYVFFLKLKMSRHTGVIENITKCHMGRTFLGKGS